MSDHNQTLRISPWLGGSVLSLMVLQLGLLWVQGSLVQRQREDILGLRDDVQAMAESLDEDQNAEQANPDGRPTPARFRSHAHRRARALRVAYFQAGADEDEVARKELEHSKESAQQGVAKAREMQSKLSITENLRKADEKAKVEAEGRKARPWLWAGAALALLAMVARSILRRRG